MSMKSFTQPITRRKMLKTASVAAAGLAVSRRAFGDTKPASTAVTAAPTLLRQLEYSQVKLSAGIMRDQFDQTHQRFLNIDNDMLLKPFRQGAGLAAPGDDMGGWYSRSRYFETNGGSDGFVPGHSFGQYMSGLSRAYAITGDRATQVKVQQLVAGLQPTLLSRFYDGYHLPGYIFDKLCCGLIDAYSFAGVESASPALGQALDAALPHLPEKALSPF